MIVSNPGGYSDDAERAGGELRVCVAIPTYRREQVLVDTIRQVLAQDPPADEVIVVDQTSDHEPRTVQALTAWQREGRIRWIKHSPPSLPGARNRVLAESQSDVVVFIDDDVILSPRFVEAHRRSYDDPNVNLVAGQVLNRDRQVYTGPVKNHDLKFPRNYGERRWIKGLFGGNHSVRRRLALDVGGYDQRYLQNAYREETDFAVRATRQLKCMVLFEPKASLVHLLEPVGGCRAWGAPRMLATGWATGDYYFALKNLSPARAAKHIAEESFHHVINRRSARHPWTIPMLLIAEVSSLLCAVVFALQKRNLIPSHRPDGEVARQEP